MKIDYLPRAMRALRDAPADVRKAFFKQVTFLAGNLHYPSLHAKKYDESRDRWQARVNKKQNVTQADLPRVGLPPFVTQAAADGPRQSPKCARGLFPCNPEPQRSCSAR